MQVRIKYWYQETLESGRWCYSGIMPLDEAKKLMEAQDRVPLDYFYENASIVRDEDGFPPFEEHSL